MDVAGNNAPRRELEARLDEIQEVLSAMTPVGRKFHIESLIRDLVSARGTLVKWSEMTGQSALIETGYIAQHLASLLLAIPGQGFRGKGIDMRCPADAIDDETAIKVVDAAVEVVSEGHWKLFTPSPVASE
jgi:hypothetical protein